ncbi:MAG: hypothetical protein GKC53_05415 [Neisseriaceae bacterium]|nr:MAG: hypothetical protein GKC53_05415 [Neisseriaceae bacterium]
MATFIEKEVLIEAASYTAGVIRRFPGQTDETKRLAKQVGEMGYNYLHSKAEDLDFYKEVEILRKMRAPYEK